MGNVIHLAGELGTNLTDIAWDFHVAIKHGNVEAATAAAGHAMELFSQFQAQTMDVEPDQPCMKEAWSAVTGSIEAERQRWLAWSEGSNHSTPDDAEVFFAFHGMPYPWSTMLQDAREMCNPSA